jgi:hypothetical protein
VLSVLLDPKKRKARASLTRAYRRASSAGFAWGSSLRHWMDRECFFNGRLNMPRGHHGFAVCLICERNERPAPPVGDVEAPTFCHGASARAPPGPLRHAP